MCIMILRKCTKCKRQLDPSEFYKSGTSLRGDCKTCHRSRSRTDYRRGGREVKLQRYRDNRDDVLLKIKERKYQISRDIIQIMSEMQNGCCKICDRVMDRPNIDHCHTTQQVRGLLCTKCNAGLGQFEDNVMFLHRAIQYLQLSGQ